MAARTTSLHPKARPDLTTDPELEYNMQSSTHKTVQYDLKTDPTTVGLKFAAALATMKSGFAAKTNSLVTSQLLTAGVLDSIPIIGPLRGRHHAFSNQLWKIKQNYDGAAATAMAQAMFLRWKTICTPADLTDIALTVHNLVVA
jgi:hypothetical protein